MPSTVTYAQARNVNQRVDNSMQALKNPAHGGPFRVEYGAGTEQAVDYKAEHPRYPDYHYPDDRERDTYYNIKQTLPDSFGEKYASDKDIQYVIDKKNAQELAIFKKFVEDSIPRGTPWAKEYFERFMPGWYQSKIEIINDKMAMVNQFIDITVRGPQNIDDMYLLYMLYQGKITLPSNWDELINGFPVLRTDFQHGLFNPQRWTNEQVRISIRNQKYLANFAIPGIDLKGLNPIFAGVANIDPHPIVAIDTTEATEAHEPVLGGGIRVTNTNNMPVAGAAPYNVGMWTRSRRGDVPNAGFGSANIFGGDPDVTVADANGAGLTRSAARGGRPV